MVAADAPLAHAAPRTRRRPTPTHHPSSFLLGPILYKSNEAAMWAWAVQDGKPDSVPLERATLTPLDGGGSLLVGFSVPRNAVILAVNASAAVSDAAWAAFADAENDQYYNWFSLASFDADRDDPLQGVLPANVTTFGLMQAAAGPQWPPTGIYASGFAWGGGLARELALFAAVYVPAANIRAITFGAPAMPDDRFEWASAQLVDLSYSWAAEGDPTIDVRVSGGTVPAGYDPPSRRWVINTHTSKWVSSRLAYSSTFYVVALQETFIRTAFWSARGGAFARKDSLRRHFAAKAEVYLNSTAANARFAEIKDMLGTSVDKLKRAIAGTEEHDPGSIPVAALPPEWPDNCKPVLCKLRRAVVQARIRGSGVEGGLRARPTPRPTPHPPSPRIAAGQQCLLGQ